MTFQNNQDAETDCSPIAFVRFDVAITKTFFLRFSLSSCVNNAFTTCGGWFQSQCESLNRSSHPQCIRRFRP